MHFWVFDTMVSTTHLTFYDMPQAPLMTHKGFKLQATWGLVIVKTETKSQHAVW